MTYPSHGRGAAGDPAALPGRSSNLSFSREGGNVTVQSTVRFAVNTVRYVAADAGREPLALVTRLLFHVITSPCRRAASVCIGTHTSSSRQNRQTEHQRRAGRQLHRSSEPGRGLARQPSLHPQPMATPRPGQSSTKIFPSLSRSSRRKIPHMTRVSGWWWWWEWW